MSLITRDQRERDNAHRARVIWLTGLSGAGKSTIADLLEKEMFYMGLSTARLDGDHFRDNLCSDLGFSIQDRTENIRRVGEVAKLCFDQGSIVIASFISPIHKDREGVRSLFSSKDFIEVHCNASLKTCEERDTKGLYKRARSGEVIDFTGISSIYEEPLDPDIYIRTDVPSVEECVHAVMNVLDSMGVFDTIPVIEP